MISTLKSRSLAAWAAIALLGAVPDRIARAEDATAGTPGEWLAQYTSARTLGMGSAFVASADDPLGCLWNPAGLSFMNRNELRFESARMFEGTTLNAAGFAVPGSRLPSLGIAMVSLGSGDFERTNEMNDALGSFRESETAYFVTAAKSLSPSLALGVNFKFVQQGLEDFHAGGFGMDAGAAMHVTPAVWLGASVMNLGGPKLQLRSVSESYPTLMRGGVAMSVLGGRGLLSTEFDHSEGLGSQLRAGAEYWIQPVLAMRFGYQDGQGSGGFSYRFTPHYQLDYGVIDHPLGMAHRVGVRYGFGGFFASAAAEPSIFSPTGEKPVTKISLNARTKAEPKTWSLEIVNKSDEVVRHFGGQGQPPSHLEWDGKDDSGLPLPDGSSRYRMTVRDAAERHLDAPTRSVVIKSTGPEVVVPVEETK